MKKINKYIIYCLLTILSPHLLYYLLFVILGLPNRVACGAQIHIFHVNIVVANVNNFTLRLLSIRLAFRVRTQNLVNTRQRRVQLCILINNMTKLLLGLL